MFVPPWLVCASIAVLYEILGGYCIDEAGGVLDEFGPICTFLLSLLAALPNPEGTLYGGIYR
jgi:hypothetical protein